MSPHAASDTPKTEQQSREAAGQALLKKALARSTTDPAFRSQLLAAPAAAFAEMTGKDVPPSFNVKFIENRGDVTLVLPPFQDASAELSEDELEAVAGGATPALWASGLAVIATIGYIFTD